MNKIIFSFPRILIVLLVLSLSACTKDTSLEKSIVSPETLSPASQSLVGNVCYSPASNPTVNFTPGASVPNTIVIDDPATALTDDRQFGIFVPSTYGQDPEQYYPLVYMHHGSGQTAQRMKNKTTWNALAEADEFIVVYPQSLAYPINGVLTTRWNTPNLINAVPAGTPLRDDVHFFRKMNEAIGETLRIYCDSIYACGFSNGSNFSKHRLRVEAPDILAATCGTGNIGDRSITLPASGTQRPHFDVCGSIDGNAVSYCQGLGEVFVELPMQPAVMATTPCIYDRIDNQRNGMELDAIASTTTGIHANGRRFTDITFRTSLVGQNTEYKYRQLKGLIHKVPSSNNGFNPDYIAIFWEWLKQWES